MLLHGSQHLLRTLLSHFNILDNVFASSSFTTHRRLFGTILLLPPFFVLFFSLAMSTTVPQTLLKIKKLSEHAILPKRGSPYSAGLDLSSSVDLVIAAGERAVVPTDLAIACPHGTYGRIAPRSGLASKRGIDVGAGVVDSDYRGPVGILLFNFGKEDFEIKRGDRVAQLILEQIVLADVEEVEDLDETVRGEGGFGSTGVAAKKQRTISPELGEADDSKSS
jgi:dUTP pyrophosphatase